MSVAPPSRRIALASGNAHKALEWQSLLRGWSVAPLDMSGAPAETGGTFHENAVAKAGYGAAQAGTDCWIIGEDSGLAVEALGGAPGVRSARFAGPNATDADNVQRLLRELADACDRAARFHCAVTCIGPLVRVDEQRRDGALAGEVHVEGSLHGTIALAASGEAGFGYDPVFVPAGEVETMAQLGEGWKRENSHRARAARALLKLLDRC